MAVHAVKRFIEKPKRDAAEKMIAAGGHYWNAGMFVWRVAQIVKAFEEHLPATAKAIDSLAEAVGTPRYEHVLAEVWEETDKTTIDYGILEKAKNVAVVPADIGWHDVGSWTRLAAIVQRSDNWSSDGHVAIAQATTTRGAGKSSRSWCRRTHRGGTRPTPADRLERASEEVKECRPPPPEEREELL